ncbi:MAG: hypothetical protein ABFR02_10380 [Campylobacterota bacterium]
MKMVKNVTTALVSIAAVVAMTACSGDDAASGGGGSSALATGGFVKEVAKNSITGVNAPFFSSTQNSQFLLLAGDIAGSGNIESISFRSFGAEVATTCADANISMGHTSLSGLTLTYADNVEEGKGTLQTVVERSLSISALAAGELFTIDLDTPFNYNGVDNVVLHVQMPTGCSNIIEIYTDTTQPDSLLHSQAIPSATGSLFAFLPNLVMNFAGGVNTQVVEGTTTGNTFPFNTALKRTQHLFTSADINGSGPLTGLAFQMNGVSTEGEYNATVKLGHTTLAEFDAANTFADNYANTATVVADNVQFTIPAGLQAGDWFWVPLNGSFNYNGTDNLIADVEVTSATVTNVVMKVDTGLLSVRAYGDAGVDLPVGVDDGAYNMKFRFNGAPMDVIPEYIGGQAFPYWNTEGAIQQLYNAYQLGSAGTINRIECRAEYNSIAETGYSYAITLSHSTAMDLTGIFADNLVTDTVEVFNGTVDTPALLAGDWVGFDLTTPFNYDGVSNLVMEIRGTGGTSGGLACRRGSVPNQQLLWGGLDSSATFGTTEANLIDTRFHVNR